MRQEGAAWGRDGEEENRNNIRYEVSLSLGLRSSLLNQNNIKNNITKAGTAHDTFKVFGINIPYNTGAGFSPCSFSSCSLLCSGLYEEPWQQSFQHDGAFGAPIITHFYAFSITDISQQT